VSAVFEVRGGRIERSARIVVDDLGLDHDVGVLALVGPAGGGKSSVLEALAGSGATEATRGGEWRCRGRDLREYWSSEAARPPGVRWVAQPRREGMARAALPAGAIGGESWREAFEDPDAAVLLDEPFRTVAKEDHEALAHAVKKHALRAPVVLVTHDLERMRALADRICLLVNGRVEANAEARSFFEEPPTPLSARFVAHGSCWPKATAPGHYREILEGSLAGMGTPGLLRPIDDDLAFLSSIGTTLLITLTEKELPREALRRHGVRARHLPIRDMHVPSLHAAAGTCKAMERVIDAGGRVVIHCRAGIGRTGTMAAAYLAWRGASAEEAITRVREVSQAYIQNAEQERFVRQFAEVMGGSA